MTSILLHQVIVAKDVSKAETSLLQLPGLRKFHSALKSDREKEDFRRHMRKYISIWLPDCQFEVSTTNRYTIVTHEASVTARQEIKKDDTVKYLVGNLVAMTPEEEKDLDLTRRDFSIVMSSRRKTPSLFLGPARFANHDCNANARLVTRGSGGMQVVAARDIGVDEEITVTYGDNYFGEGNCECLCLTCEKAGRGAWSAAAANSCGTPVFENEEGVPRSSSLRISTRKRSRLSGFSDSLSPQLEASKKRRTKATSNSSGLAKEASVANCTGFPRVSRKRPRLAEETDSKDEEMSQSTARKRTRAENSKLCRSPANPYREKKVAGSLKVVGYQTPERLVVSAPKIKRTPSAAKKTIPASPVADSMFNELSAALKRKPLKAKAPAVEEYASSIVNTERSTDDIQVIELVAPTSSDSAHCVLQAIDKPTETPISSSEHESIFDATVQVSSPATTPRCSEELEIGTKPAGPRNAEGSDGELSELGPEAELDDTSMTVMEKSPKCKRAPRGSKILPTIEVEDASLRIPGDYTRTPLLLGEKYSRWVDCRTCSGCWVQQNGYQTRKECPRCERHSKLFGFRWPKTAQSGEDDEEERVMDHRTVHRFIRPHEERLLVKRGKGCVRAGSESTSRTNSILAENDKRPVSRLRESVRGRRGSQLR